MTPAAGCASCSAVSCLTHECCVVLCSLHQIVAHVRMKSGAVCVCVLAWVSWRGATSPPAIRLKWRRIFLFFNSNTMSWRDSQSSPPAFCFQPQSELTCSHAAVSQLCPSDLMYFFMFFMIAVCQESHHLLSCLCFPSVLQMETGFL